MCSMPLCADDLFFVIQKHSISWDLIFWLLVLVSVLFVYCSESVLLCYEFKTIPHFVFYQIQGIWPNFKVLDTLELIFMLPRMYKSISVLLHVAISSDHYYSLKMLSLNWVCISVFFAKIKSDVHRHVDLHLSFNLIHLSMCLFLL